MNALNGRLTAAVLLASFALTILLLRPAGASEAAVAKTIRASGQPDELGTDYAAYIPAILSPEPPPRLKLEPFATGFDTDTIADIANAGDQRLFVVQHEGVIAVVMPDGTILPEPFLDISGDTTHDNWEEGMLGLAFHPDYPQTPYLYVSYTSNFGAKIRLRRFTVSETNPNEANAKSGQSILTIVKPLNSPVHNGGDLSFGPDGYLYMSVGDGGPDPIEGSGLPGDPNNNSQNMGSLLGKMLRIDVDKEAGLAADCGEDANYSIPPDNPFVNQAGVCGAIWASGLRNPWRHSFDSANGDLYIGDVGEWQREEIDFVAGARPGGQNYGWHCYEGSLDYSKQYPSVADGCGPSSQYTFPIYEYAHPGNGCSVIGGFVYRGSAFPALVGRYIFADFCNGRIWTMMRNKVTGVWEIDPSGQSGTHISTFGEGADGELYAGHRNAGGDITLFRVITR